MRRAAFALASVFACSSSPAAKPDGGADAGSAIDAAPTADAAPANTVTISPFEAPDFIAYRNGNGPWQTPASDGSGGFTLTVGNDYVVVMVCDGGGVGTSFDAEMFALTFAGDGPIVQSSCFQSGGAATATGAGVTTVTGTMAQPGSVQIGGGSAGSGSAAWPYSIDVASGMHDVAGIGSDNNIQLVRDVDLEGATAAGPAIDVDLDGAALVQQALTLDNLAADPVVLASDDLFTTDVIAISQVQAPTEITLPSALLQATDFQFLQILAFGQTSEQSATVELQGVAQPPATYAMLPPFTTAGFKATSTSASATWTALPVADFKNLQLFVGDGQGAQQQVVTMSPSWITARAATGIEFDTSAPGYLAAWKVDTTKSYFVELQLTQVVAPVTYGTAAGAQGPMQLAARHAKAIAKARAAQVSGARRRIVP